MSGEFSCPKCGAFNYPEEDNCQVCSHCLKPQILPVATRTDCVMIFVIGIIMGAVGFWAVTNFYPKCLLS